MRRIINKKISQWLLPAVLVLFVLEVLMLPAVLEITYAGRGEGPDHILTYTTNQLVWDDITDIDADGVAVLNLFDSIYENVDGNGDKVVAPGTTGSSIIRLKNGSNDTVQFTAVLYRIVTNDAIPVEVGLEGYNFTQTDDYQLPDQVIAEQVVVAVTGEVQSSAIQDFDITWVWNYAEGEDQDTLDTILGNAEEEGLTVGLYIVVEDEGSVIEPQPPGTGDRSRMPMYLTLMAISLLVLILLMWERHKEKKCAR